LYFSTTVLIIPGSKAPNNIIKLKSNFEITSALKSINFHPLHQLNNTGRIACRLSLFTKERQKGVSRKQMPHTVKVNWNNKLHLQSKKINNTIKVRTTGNV
jgi:hypothetical protein